MRMCDYPNFVFYCPLTRTSMRLYLQYFLPKNSRYLRNSGQSEFMGSTQPTRHFRLRSFYFLCKFTLRHILSFQDFRNLIGILKQQIHLNNDIFRNRIQGGLKIGELTAFISLW